MKLLRKAQIHKSINRSRWLKNLKTRKNAQIIAVTIVAGSVLAFGLSRAASNTANIEAENGSPTSNVGSVADASASGGTAVRFGSHHAGHTCSGPQVSMNLCLNPATVPSPVVGESQNRLKQTFTPGYPYFSDSAAVRVNCMMSHVSKDDPIVYPGQNDAAHWHIFLGNTAADENLTDTRAQGNSTCEGGAVNKTAYWAPVLVDTNSYNSTTGQFNNVPTMRLDDPNPLGGSARGGMPLQIYYKSGYWGVLAKDVQPFPQGLKMIAGANAAVEPTGPHASVSAGYRYVAFDCISWGHAQSYYNDIRDRTQIPADCPPGFFIQARITFPQCGARDAQGNPVLDSPNHRSHMAYPLGWPDRGCPSSHPIAYPEIIEEFRWKVPSTGASGLRFSSDMYPNAAAGWTFHADWWNGWDPVILQQIIDHCFHGNDNGQIRGRDCGTGGDATLFPNPSGGYYGLDGARNTGN